jgi:hypothetical protein
VNPAGEGRHALVVATAHYHDPKLQQLRAPAADAERLAAVLRDPAKGNFQVDVLLDEAHERMTRGIARFFRDRRPQDLLLLHFSCHGVKDDRGELYLAATDTELDLLSATGVSAAWLNDQITRTRSRRTVVLLDCCFSGSFPFGMRARGSGIDAPEQLQGRGRVIITASNAIEYAYEGDELQGEGQPSVFTEAVVEGLSTGEADLDNDQLVSVDDLYNYGYDRVKEATPSQTPSKKSDLEGPLYLAKSSYRREITPARLDPELLAATEDRYAGIREGAVQELAELLKSRDPSVVLAARHALTRMLGDDSRRVSASAQDALSAAGRRDADPVGAPAEARDDATRDPRHDPPGGGLPPSPIAASGELEPGFPTTVADTRAPSPRAPAASKRWRLLAAVATLTVVAAVLAVVLTGGDGGSAGGGDAGSDAGVVPAGNLTSNPSFEEDLAGWDTFRARLERVPVLDAPDGDYVARVNLAASPGEYSIDDRPAPVRSSVAGRMYTATAFVKATSDNDGRQFCIGVRESSTDADEGDVGEIYGAVTGSADGYRQLRVSYVAKGGGNDIDVHVFRNPNEPVRRGEAFLVDAIVLVAGGAAQSSSSECA